MSNNSFPAPLAEEPAALIDLVSTDTPDQRDEALGLITTAAQSVGGRVTLANRALTPMILPDDSNPQADDGISLLAISEYATGSAARAAVDARDRNISGPLAGITNRTWATRPAGRIRSFLGRNLPGALALLSRASVPNNPSIEDQRTLIEEGLILSDQNSTASRWQTLLERAEDRPIWMLNMLEFRATAQYTEEAGQAAPSTPIVGSEAYQRYGQSMASTLGAVGGRVRWESGRLHQVDGPDEGTWHQLGIAEYPSPAAMLTMLAMPKYRAAHVHREAALARTRLLATRPLGTRNG